MIPIFIYALTSNSRCSLDISTWFMSPKDIWFAIIWLVSVLQEEQVEWVDVNKLLQHHGFKPVMFADPVENKNLSGMWYICVHVYFQYAN